MRPRAPLAAGPWFPRVAHLSSCLIQHEQLRQTFSQREDLSPKKKILSKPIYLAAITHYWNDCTPSSGEPQLNAQLVTNGFDMLDPFSGRMLDV